MGGIYTIDLNKALNKVQQQLGDRIEDDGEQRLPPTTEIVDFDVYVDNFEADEEFEDEEMDEEYIDEEEEKAQRLQYFRERRFSVFPIA